MLEGLFSSRVRSKLLTILFLSSENGLNAHELSLRIGESYSAVWRELNRLEKIGILQSDKFGISKVFTADPRCPIASELRGLVLKTEGFGGKIRASLSNFANIQAAFIYGSFASGEVDAHSDIDLMIIGELDLAAFSMTVSQLEKDLNRPINYTLFTPVEWSKKISTQDPFAINVMQSPKVMLIGAENGL